MPLSSEFCVDSILHHHTEQRRHVLQAQYKNPNRKFNPKTAWVQRKPCYSHLLKYQITAHLQPHSPQHQNRRPNCGSRPVKDRSPEIFIGAKFEITCKNNTQTSCPSQTSSATSSNLYPPLLYFSEEVNSASKTARLAAVLCAAKKWQIGASIAKSIRSASNGEKGEIIRERRKRKRVQPITNQKNPRSQQSPGTAWRRQCLLDARNIP